MYRKNKLCLPNDDENIFFTEKEFFECDNLLFYFNFLQKIFVLREVIEQVSSQLLHV